jgi:hypothetical protein
MLREKRIKRKKKDEREKNNIYTYNMYYNGQWPNQLSRIRSMSLLQFYIHATRLYQATLQTISKPCFYGISDRINHK